MQGKSQETQEIQAGQQPKVPERLKISGEQAGKQDGAACAAGDQKGPQLPLGPPQQKEEDCDAGACGPQQVQPAGQSGQTMAQGPQQIVAQGDGGPQQDGLGKGCQRRHPSRRLQKPPPAWLSSS